MDTPLRGKHNFRQSLAIAPLTKTILQSVLKRRHYCLLGSNNEVLWRLTRRKVYKAIGQQIR